ncbi:hypothetical protein M8J76_011434 [Diaphorina citri]|nr:hypothetical protein M8J75_003083 [Diaphorina citri]KAI5741204.1 hypothetical protein M8J76_011434 [Diaphorina citri]KAI5746215.1 hypothetical protein M8J77_001234 [Diaphorina citri]KAI5746224.1 hypothetical protein M8J77_001272 [Diaphorina citri]
MSLPPPVSVSPLIKFARWTMLSAGILYGVSRQSSLEKKEEKLRVIRAQKKAIKDAKLAEEKKRANEAELAELSKMAGSTIA